jgi:hypothetical protein
MADTKISDLTEGTVLADADEFVFVDKSDTSMSADGTTKRALWSTIKAYLALLFVPIAWIKAFRGHRHGIAVSNNATDANNDIDFGAGTVWDNANDVLLELSSAKTKRLDASWVFGTNQGGLFSGTKAANTWYHAFIIRRSDTGDVDAGFDTSFTAANKPANYDQFRRRFSILTDGSGNIRPFLQWGDYILWKTPIVDQNGITVGTTASLLTLSVPPGVRVQPLLSVATGLKAAAAPGIYFSSPDVTDVAASFPGAMTTGANAVGQSTATTGLGEIVLSNTSSQIRARCTDASTTAWVATQGWLDPAGRYE